MNNGGPIKRKPEKKKRKHEQIILKYIGNTNPKGSWEDSFMTDAISFIVSNRVGSKPDDSVHENKITPSPCLDARRKHRGTGIGTRPF
jgi:hypothetical protein